MRIYSDLLGKPFDTEAECLKAEKEYKDKQRKIQDEINRAVAEKKAKEEAENVSKKEMAKSIETAQSKVDEANSLYEAAKTKAQSILDDAKKHAKEILDAAKLKVREAETAKYEAISAFNKKFGPYTTTLTGEKAANELKRAFDKISDFWSFWNIL